MSRAANPFRSGAVLGLLLVGAASFLLLLYALGEGWTGDGDGSGAHAGSPAIDGYAGLAELLEGMDYEVELTRNRGRSEDYGLLVLTPSHQADAEDLAAILDQRRDYQSGPTLVILPKWIALPIPPDAEVEAGDGWQLLETTAGPGWWDGLEISQDTQLLSGTTAGSWSGLGLSGDLPRPDVEQALRPGPGAALVPLVTDSEGDVLVARESVPGAQREDMGLAPVVFVFEPDLLNNYGMAERTRAQFAARLVSELMGGDDLPVIFDQSAAGLGASQNLLTLAFRPPFLAATWCLLLAALVIAWRGFRRFGPPRAELAAMAKGKRQLVRNGAGLVARLKRWHLLKQPYEDMVGRRIATGLGLRVADHGERESAIDRALTARGAAGPSFSRLATDLRAARRPADIIRAASALWQFERTLKR